LGIATEQVAYVGLDLTKDDLDAALIAAGHDVTTPTLCICEGLLLYLRLDSIANLFDTLRRRAAAGSTLALNVRVHGKATAINQAGRQLMAGLLTAIAEAPRTTFEPGDIEKLLTLTGWTVARSEHSARNGMDNGFSLLVAAELASRGSSPA
jgi:methyltransferase (TIGR00027 family)